MITEQDLIDAGFQQEFNTRLDITLPTGYWVLPGWVPEPKIDFRYPKELSVARIEKVQIHIKTKEALIGFAQKTVPIFCDPK